MPSTFDTSLVDELVPVVDDIRASILPDMGVRQWSASLMRRTWSGERPGDGTPGAASVALTLSTPPKIMREVANHLQPAGLEEEGEIVITQVSFTYTEAELTGQPVAANEEIFWKITDAHGQGIAPRYYTQSKPPRPMRDSRSAGLGWMLSLRRIQDMVGA